jgi:uncharacterized protein with GYD domain
MEAPRSDTFAVVLIKCQPGDEEAIRKRIDEAQAGKPFCFRQAGAMHDAACSAVTVHHIAYCFGPFDFVLVLRSPDVRFIERFVVDCIRAEGRIVDTQTILGIGLFSL